MVHHISTRSLPYCGKGLDVWAFITIFQPLAYTIAYRPSGNRVCLNNEHNSQHKDHTLWLGFDPGIVTNQKVSTVPLHVSPALVVVKRETRKEPERSNRKLLANWVNLTIGNCRTLYTRRLVANYLTRGKRGTFR